ncbi:hypothetical protein TGVEG_256220, partial [Toxoplasma gondii VEG]
MSAERQSSSCDCVLEATDCASGTGNEGVAFAVDSFRGFLPLEVVCDCRPSPCDGTLEPADPMDSPGTWLVNDFDVDFLRARFPLEETSAERQSSSCDCVLEATDCASGTGNEGVAFAVDSFRGFLPLEVVCDCRPSPCDGTLEPADPMDSPGTWLVDDFDVDFLRARFPLEETSAERQSSSCDCVLEATDCASGTGNEGVAFAVDSFRGFLPLEVVCDCRPSPCDGTLEPADPMDSPGTWLVDDFDVDFLRARFPLGEMSAERQSSSCDCVLEATDCASGTGNEGVAFAVDSFRGFLPLEVVCDCRPSPCDGTLEPADPMDSP